MNSIQFSGLPAVGKTTFVHYLVNKYPDKYCLPVLEITDKKGVFDNWKYFLKVMFNPKYLAFIFLAFISVITSGLNLKFSMEAISGIFINLINYEINKSRSSGKIILWDEMLSQRCFSCLGYAKSFNGPSKGLFILMNALSSKICSSFLLVANEDFSSRLYKRGITERMKDLKEDDLNCVIKTHVLLNEYAVVNSKKLICIDTFNYEDYFSLE